MVTVPRRLRSALVERLDQTPAVVLTGPRQSGKTTLALEVAETRPSIYLDLEAAADRAKLSEPALFLAEHADELVILDEVQRTPDLFAELRGVIDRRRRAEQRAGMFLLLGSASLDLLRQSSESLAGRVSYVELGPFDALETDASKLERLFVRGGFPESLLARTERVSARWRQDFIRTYLERDIPTFGPRIPAETLRRFWTMLAHQSGGMLNAANLARSLAVDGKTVSRYLDLMVDLLLVRRLQPFHGNVQKRLVRSPKVYLRDSGIVHTLLGLADRDAVLGHPVVGGSYEGFVIENLIRAAPEGTDVSFYRTSAGAEIDLLLDLPGGERWAVEVKRSLAPKLARGFYSACEDLAVRERFVVYPGPDEFPSGDRTRAISLPGLCSRLVSR